MMMNKIRLMMPRASGTANQKCHTCVTSAADMGTAYGAIFEGWQSEPHQQRGSHRVGVTHHVRRRAQRAAGRVESAVPQGSTTGPKGEDTFDLRFEIERFKAAQTLGEMGLDERGAFLGELAVDELIHLGEDLGT